MVGRDRKLQVLLQVLQGTEAHRRLAWGANSSSSRVALHDRVGSQHHSNTVLNQRTHRPIPLARYLEGRLERIKPCLLSFRARKRTSSVAAGCFGLVGTTSRRGVVRGRPSHSAIAGTSTQYLPYQYKLHKLGGKVREKESNAEQRLRCRTVGIWPHVACAPSALPLLRKEARWCLAVTRGLE